MGFKLPSGRYSKATSGANVHGFYFILNFFIYSFIFTKVDIFHNRSKSAGKKSKSLGRRGKEWEMNEIILHNALWSDPSPLLSTI